MQRSRDVCLIIKRKTVKNKGGSIVEISKGEKKIIYFKREITKPKNGENSKNFKRNGISKKEPNILEL